MLALCGTGGPLGGPGGSRTAFRRGNPSELLATIMRILLAPKHDYPARQSVGSGLRPKRFPSGSGGAIHDLIAKGLAELRHDVLYLAPHAVDQGSAMGITLIPDAVLTPD